MRGAALASSMSEYLIRQLDAAPNVDVRFQTRVVDGTSTGRLERLVLQDSAVGGPPQEVPAAALFVLIGAEPHTGWLPNQLARDGRGYLQTGADATRTEPRRRGRAPLLLETSMAGVFAAGDVRSGSPKRVASAVGEGALAIQLCHQYLSAGQQ